MPRPAPDMQHGATCACRMGGECDCRVAEDVVSKKPELKAAPRNLFDNPRVRVDFYKARLGDSIERALYLASMEPTQLNPKQQADIIVDRLLDFLTELSRPQ